jgi:hypothetical protein
MSRHGSCRPGTEQHTTFTRLYLAGWQLFKVNELDRLCFDKGPLGVNQAVEKRIDPMQREARLSGAEEIACCPISKYANSPSRFDIPLVKVHGNDPHRLLSHGTLVRVTGRLVVVRVGNEAGTCTQNGKGLNLEVSGIVANFALIESNHAVVLLVHIKVLDLSVGKGMDRETW